MPHRIPRRAARSASVRTNGLQREDMVHAERFQHLRFLQHTKRGSTKRLTGRPPRRDRSFGRVRVGRTRHLLCCHDFRTGRWNAGLLEDCRFRLVLSGTRQEFELRTEIEWVSLSNAITVRFFTVRLHHFGGKDAEVNPNSRLGATVISSAASTGPHIVTWPFTDRRVGVNTPMLRREWRTVREGIPTALASSVSRSRWRRPHGGPLRS